MKNIKRIIIISLVGLIVLIGAIVFVTSDGTDTTLEFKVIDTVSKGWVWDCTITMSHSASSRNRIMKSYYQTNKGAGTLVFTNLEPGVWNMKVSAPHYKPVVKEVLIRGGGNVLDTPIEMTGLEIPGIEKFFLFPGYDKDKHRINIELRPAQKNESGKWQAIVNHPALDIRIGCRVHVQIKDGVFVKQPTTEGSDRGQQLFKGSLEWKWDTSPDNIYRYSASLPGLKIKNHVSPLRVYDFIILLPLPGKISAIEMDTIMKEALELDEDDIPEFLSRYEEQLTYYIDVSWNVPALQ